jgi:proteic killer suppression protein
MIRNFKHKGLKAFYTKNDPRKLPVPRQHHDKVARALALLAAVERPAELAAFPTYRFHPLHQYDPVKYSLDVSPNYRLHFTWEGSDAVDVDILDPH